MQIRYYKEYSRYLDRFMEFKVSVTPDAIIFPCQSGAFMIGKTETCATWPRPGSTAASCRSSRLTASIPKAGTTTVRRASRCRSAVTTISVRS